MKVIATPPHAAELPRALKALALLCCAAAFAMPSTAQAQDDQTMIFPPDGKTYGKTYGELAGAWWDWAVNQPPDMNPILDTTGEFAAVGQDEDYGQGGHIFFLAGNFGGETVRQCTIPAGKALFFPIVNGLWIAPEEGSNEECRQAVNDFLGFPAQIACSIDGVPVNDLRAYRAQSPPGGSPFHIRAGGLLESLAPDFYVPRGYTTGSVADGYWLLVKLGPSKQHVIEFSGTSANPDAPFELDVTYLITVVGDGDNDGSEE